MNKLEFIEALQSENDLTKNEARVTVNLFFDKMSSALAKGGRVEIRGLCCFFIKQYDGYNGRNPKTGEKIKVPPKRLPFFKAGLGLKRRVDGCLQNEKE